jgi:hypothetical protein
VSSGVGLVFDVSALRDTGSPIWVGFFLARSLRDFWLLFWEGGVSFLVLVGMVCHGGVVVTEGAMIQVSDRVADIRSLGKWNNCRNEQTVRDLWCR